MDKPCPECGTPLDQVPLARCTVHDDLTAREEIDEYSLEELLAIALDDALASDHGF